MTVQLINIGGYANDGTGDDLRTAFEKVNSNFTMLDAEAAIAGGVNLGSGTGIFADKNSTNLEFKSLTSSNSSVSFSHTATEIDVHAATSLQNDSTPSLGGALNLAGHYVYGGDVQTTVFGLDVRLMNSILALALETNQFNIDLQTFGDPAAYVADFGSLSAPPANTYDFGTFV